MTIISIIGAFESNKFFLTKQLVCLDYTLDFFEEKKEYLHLKLLKKLNLKKIFL